MIKRLLFIILLVPIVILAFIEMCFESCYWVIKGRTTKEYFYTSNWIEYFIN